MKFIYNPKKLITNKADIKLQNLMSPKDHLIIARVYTVGVAAKVFQ